MFVRIRICGIIGFSRFYRLVCDWRAVARFCQNQDLRDYRIFRILPARLRLASAWACLSESGFAGLLDSHDFTVSSVIGERLRAFVRIRICGIIGFSGFYRLVCDWRALIRIHAWRNLRLWRKAQARRIEILKIPTILILTRTPSAAFWIPAFAGMTGGRIGNDWDKIGGDGAHRPHSSLLSLLSYRHFSPKKREIAI